MFSSFTCFLKLSFFSIFDKIDSSTNPRNVFSSKRDSLNGTMAFIGCVNALATASFLVISSNCSDNTCISNALALNPNGSGTPVSRSENALATSPNASA